MTLPDVEIIDYNTYNAGDIPPGISFGFGDEEVVYERHSDESIADTRVFRYGGAESYVISTLTRYCDNGNAKRVYDVGPVLTMRVVGELLFKICHETPAKKTRFEQ